MSEGLVVDQQPVSSTDRPVAGESDSPLDDQVGRNREFSGLSEGSQVFMDMSDMLMYLYHHSVVSGIQRVIAEVLPQIDAAVNCQLVTFSASRSEFVVLDKSAMLDLLDHIWHAQAEDAVRTRQLVVEIQDTIDQRPGLRVRPGDVLALLGAAWVYEGLFQAVTSLKSQGAAVVVLIYDLIPVVFPGFAEAMILQFRQYLPKVAALADRVPAISAHSRFDFERYCRARGLTYPGGAATGLAADQWSEERLAKLAVAPGPAWPRPYVLLVSTVEARKNHILAFRCWQRLLAEHGSDFVPDLVCVGRIGWNVFEFLSEFEETAGLGGRVHLLSNSLSDARLTALYRDCLFTVYPSRYEGWGLPITESLSAGKPVVAARNTSLTEAGGDFARYFEDDDLDGFYGAVAAYLLEPQRLALDAERIQQDYRALGWNDVAAVLIAEFEAARANRRALVRRIESGCEYGLMTLPTFEGGLEGLAYLDFIHAQRRLPLTGQVMGVGRAVASDLVISGSRVTRNASGRTVQPGGHLTISFERPACPDPALVLVLAEAPTSVNLRVGGPVGVTDFILGAGEAFRVPLGTGVTGELLTVELRTCPGSQAQEFTVASFVLSATAGEAEVLVTKTYLRAIAIEKAIVEQGRREAAELERARLETVAQLEQLTSSTSWRVTRPMRAAVEALRRARRK